MNKMKKFASIATVILMTACMTAPMMSSFAADDPAATTPTTPSITINTEAKGHKYEAYQIFKGTLSGTVLSNIDWGSGVDTTKRVNWGTADAPDEKTLVEAIQAIKLSDNTTPFDGKTKAADIAKVLSDAAANKTAAQAKDLEITKEFAKVVGEYLSTTKFKGDPIDNKDTVEDETDIKGYKIDLEDEANNGYYLVQDEAGSVAGNDSYTRYIIAVAGTRADISPKKTMPSVEKKVFEESQVNTDDGWGNGYNDVADYDISDSVPFKLYGSLPSDAKEYDEYEAYFYQFNDTLGTQFDAPDVANIHVYYETATSKKEIVNEYPADADTEEKKANYIKLTTGDMVKKVAGQQITITIENIKDVVPTINGDTGKITVEYKAVLNNTANVGYEGQVNGVNLEYSNNPNSGWKPTKDTTPDKPDQPDTPDTPDDKGKTPDDGVIVFTYGIDINKVIAGTADPSQNKDAEKLAGAVFGVFYQAYDTNTTVDVDGNETVTEYKQWILPGDANANPATEDTIYYESEGTYYTREVNTDTGVKTYTEATLDDATKKKLVMDKVYITTDDNGVLTGTLSERPTGEEISGAAGAWESKTTGNIVIKGLDKGRLYYLDEIKAPDTYNILTEPIDVEIISSLEGAEIYMNQKWNYSTLGNNQVEKPAEDNPNYTALDLIQIKVAGGTEENVKDNIIDRDSSTDDTDLGTIDAENSKGASLPEAGGIGTTLFYVGGGAMVAVAGIFLITKKRMGRKED